MAELVVAPASSLRVGDTFLLSKGGDPESARLLKSVVRIRRRNEMPWPSEVIDIDYALTRSASETVHAGTFDPNQEISINPEVASNG